jgi:hypothetical protein
VRFVARGVGGDEEETGEEREGVGSFAEDDVADGDVCSVIECVFVLGRVRGRCR